MLCIDFEQLVACAGTNVMIRAKGMFLASKFYDPQTDTLLDNAGIPQLLCEHEISEDIELGSRMHAHGYKSILISERLVTGEVCVTSHAIL
jgi:hypothetical protein